MLRRLATLTLTAGLLLGAGACGFVTPHNPNPLPACPLPTATHPIGHTFGWGTCTLTHGAHILPMVDGKIPTVAPGSPSEIDLIGGQYLVYPAGFWAGNGQSATSLPHHVAGE